MFLPNLVNVVPDLLLCHSSFFGVFFGDRVKFLHQRLLLGFYLILLKLMMPEHFFDLVFLHPADVFEVVRITGVLVHFGLVQVLEPLLIRFHLLSLVLVPALKLVLVVLHHLQLPFSVSPLLLVKFVF